VRRLLARHGWRKLVPRPYHPDASRQQQEAFKKVAPAGAHRSHTTSPARLTTAIMV
jgi:Winged helix-turn helix